jgi:hypothetical protein
MASVIGEIEDYLLEGTFPSEKFPILVDPLKCAWRSGANKHFFRFLQSLCQKLGCPKKLKTEELQSDL